MNLVIKIVSAFIPVKGWRKKFRARFKLNQQYKLYQSQQKEYCKIVKQIKQKVRDGAKIRVGFFVVFDSVFPAKTIFEAMQKDELFETYIVIIPDAARGEENQYNQLNKSYNYFLQQYGENAVIHSFDKSKKAFIDFSNQFDLVCFSNPYDGMTQLYYTVEYNAKKGILPFYVNYGTPTVKYVRNCVMNLPSLNLCWKIFADTQENVNDMICFTDLRGKNTILSGYCKMDALNQIQRKPLSRKKIIIAPHHTVEYPALSLSTFLDYADFFVEIYQRYPQIDFVFRPHPVLFVTLAKPKLWGQKKVDEYLQKVSSFPNVEYQNGGDYFDTFVNSSAMIHDCASFLMEYLYTNHPVCYLLKNKNEIEKEFAPIGQKCLANSYQAFNKTEIINFIENVVLKEDDPMKSKRTTFAKQEIMINYPNATNVILQNIKKSFE